MATAGGKKRAVWIDGRKVAEWEHAKPLVFTEAPPRIGALGRSGEAAGFLDADIAMPVFKAYSGAPFSPAWPGVANIGTKGYRPEKNDPIAPYCFYRFHRAGQPAYQLGWRIPWPVASPYAIYSPAETGYAHLAASNLWSFSWLRDNACACDALSDHDLHADPGALDGAKVLFIAGHNEYWSREAMARTAPSSTAAAKSST